ncbi:MAG: hypothetical protein K6G28_03675 [Acholeplasmatales bacterium]|nr:hypothetical protein [Acholeplasmatales bacterium]
MEIRDREKYIELYDVYKSLLTDKKKEYFEEYYLFDYSLQEIADNHNVSRNACFDAIKKSCDALDKYEDKLHILSKNKALENALKCDDLDEVKQIINKIIEE